MKKRSAYTLIEIIVVIAILGIVMAISLPNTNYFNKIKENLEVKELRRDMLYSRNKAILDSKDYKITFDVERNSYTVDRGIGLNRIVIMQKTFESGTVLCNKDGGNVIVFKANGAVGKSDTIYFYDRIGDMYRLTVTPVSCKVNIVKHKSKS